jgi:hypothetical protein
MQITEKLRTEIALALPNLGFAEATEIAKDCLCSHDTVYREWRKIHGREKGKSLASNPVVVSLAELAAKRKAETKKLTKRMAKSMKQLSAA